MADLISRRQKNKIRIIPRLEIKSQNESSPSVIKGIYMEGLRKMGLPWELAKSYFLQGADELIIEDIVATLYRRPHNFELLKKISQDVLVPICVGGGIRSLHDFEQCLESGADKVFLNSSALKDSKLIKEAAHHFGSQCVVVLIQAKFQKLFNCPRDGYWEPYWAGGRNRSNRNLLEWLREVQEMGAGEIALYSVDRDGSAKGPDLQLLEEVHEVVKVPLIVGSGIGKLEDAVEMAERFSIDAISLSHCLHFNKFTIPELKEELFNNGINICRQTLRHAELHKGFK